MASDDRASARAAMADLRLSRGRFRAILTGAVAPEVELLLDGDVVGSAELSPVNGGAWTMTAAVPDSVLGDDGVCTIVFRERGSGAVLGSYPFRAGAALDGDVVATLDALRSEFEALRRAFMAEASDPKLRVAERPLIVAEAVTEALRVVASSDDDTSSGGEDG